MSGGIKVDVPAFWENGYQILRGVYTPEEVKKFREAVQRVPRGGRRPAVQAADAERTA